MGMHRRSTSLAVLAAGALAFWPASAPAASASAIGGAGRTASARAAVCGGHAAAASLPAALLGVTAISPGDAWAAGHLPPFPYRPVLAHWNGSGWAMVSSPVLQSPAELTAVAAFPGGVWAVGASGQATGGQHRTHLILRVSGGTVRTVPTPGPQRGWLLGVAATSARNAWAVGYVSGGGPLILHWNGTAWKRSRLPGVLHGGQVHAVAATSATNAWAVFTRNRGSSQIWHWNGRRWGRAVTPAITGQTYALDGMAAVSARNAWAVGQTSLSGDTVILHWDGARWRRTPSPSPLAPGGDFLGGVSASSAGNAWAVGSTTKGEILVEHWDGTSWKLVRTTPRCGSLSGVSVLPSGRAWAVGSVILRWNGSAWHSVPLT